MERGVQARREVPGPELTAELRATVDRRVAALRERGWAPDDEVVGVMGRPVPFARMLPIRIFDLWAHEQDIRAALGEPPTLTSLGADVSFGQITGAFPYLVGKQAGAQPGQSVVLEATGERPTTLAVAVGDDGRAAPTAPPADPTVRLRLDAADLVARACGRAGATDTPVDVEGDRDLAERVLAALPMTP